MVPGSNGQHSQHYSKVNQNLHLIEDMLEHHPYRKKDCSGIREKEETELGTGHRGKDNTTEVDLTVEY